MSIKYLNGEGGTEQDFKTACSNSSRFRLSALWGHPFVFPSFVRWVSLRVAEDDGFTSDVGSSCCKMLSQQQQVPYEKKMEGKNQIYWRREKCGLASSAGDGGASAESGSSTRPPPPGDPTGWCPAQPLAEGNLPGRAASSPLRWTRTPGCGARERGAAPTWRLPPRQRLPIHQPPNLPVRHLASPRVNTGRQTAAAATPYGVLSNIPRAALTQ